MKREIKFRAFYAGRMYEVYNIGLSRNTVNISLPRFPFSQDVVPEAIVQYTGLKDSKGTEIWEGDVLKWKTSEQQKEDEFFEESDVVRFYNGGFFAGASLTNWTTNPPNQLWRRNYVFPGSIVSGDLYYMNREIEVIGNIYEHSHLLKS